MDGQAMMEELREKYPGAFEGWDGFEVTITVRNRKGETPLCLVTLYNKASGDYVVDLHTCLMLSSNDEGQDVIEVGCELNVKFDAAYYPGE